MSERMNDWKNGKIEVYPDADALAWAAATHFVEQAALAMRDRGCFVVALAGGTTPRATYERLASAEFATRVNWRLVHILWSDERCVPPRHHDSNYRMARAVLLDHILIPSDNVRRIRGELPPAQAAAAYESELEAALGTGGVFDLIILGMGADGHTASLFPSTPALEERTRWVVENYVDTLKRWRVTLTPPVINAARQVIILVSGAAKAETLVRVRDGYPLPVGLVQPSPGQLTWLVDRAAAAELPATDTAIDDQGGEL